MKILIAPWGWPGMYKKSRYKFNANEPLASNTSTGVLKKLLDPDHTILIFPDSLAVYNPQSYNAQTYEDLVNSLKDFLFEHYVSNPAWMPDFNQEKDSMLISPNVGTFVDKDTKRRLNIEGKLSDYYYWIFYNLSCLILDIALNSKDITLILDTSHGINFMSYLTFSALYNIGAALELLRHENVKLKIYNADPYVEVAKYLEINLVRELTPKMQLIKKHETGRFLPIKADKEKFSDRGKFQKLSKEISEIFRQYEKTYSDVFLPFLGSFSQGVVNGIVHFFPEDSSEIENKVCDIFNSNISIIHEQEKISLRISRKTYFTEYFETLVYVRNLRKIMQTMGFGKKTETSLEELDQLADELYKNFPVIRNRIKYEIDHLEKDEFRKSQVSKWIEFGSCTGEIDNRNFFAHAGLSLNTLSFKYKENKFWIRYCPDNLERIKRILIDTVRRRA